MKTSIKQMTVSEYSDFKKADLNTTQGGINYLSKLTGKPVEYFENIDRELLSKKYMFAISLIADSENRFKKHKTIWIGFKRFKCSPDVTSLSANRWTALKGLEKDLWGKFPNVLALFYYRAPLFRNSNFDLDKVKANTEIFKDAKVSKFLGMFFFYTKRSEALNANLMINHQMMMSAQMEIQEEVAQMISSAENGDGFIP